jgi:type I restriction enzyme S subunit
MQGKLVPQDPSDQPASELLKEIQAEKERLIKEGKIKRQKDLPPIKPEEVPYEVPMGWVWVRFFEITINRDGERIPVSKEDRQKMQGGYDYYGASGVIDKIDKYLFDKDLLLIGEDGANLLNRSTPIAFMAKGKYWVNNHAHVIDSAVPEILLFLVHYFASIRLDKYVTGTAQPKMNQEKMHSILIALPPLAEQKRIVDKIDELMALCDKLEAQRKTCNDKRLAVHTAAIKRLLTAGDKNDFASSWQFITRHFDQLYSVKENVAELKKAILTLAMQGKLVEQDPKDQPASELLKEIQAEKERLIKEGKIKKQKELPPIKPEEVPYDVPEGWEWVRLGDLLLKYGAGSTPLGGRRVYKDNGIIFLRSQNVWNNGLRLDDVARIDKLIHEKMEGTRVRGNDILLNITGASIGRSAVYPINFEEANVSQHVAILRMVNTNIVHYLHMVILSSYFQKMIMDRQVGVSREGLSMAKLKEFLIPFPPQNEQRRIVKKVELLFSRCDELDYKILVSKRTQAKICETVLSFEVMK